jgi:hypothetical protein
LHSKLLPNHQKWNQKSLHGLYGISYPAARLILGFFPCLMRCDQLQVADVTRTFSSILVRRGERAQPFPTRLCTCMCLQQWKKSKGHGMIFLQCQAMKFSEGKKLLFFHVCFLPCSKREEHLVSLKRRPCRGMPVPCPMYSLYTKSPSSSVIGAQSRSG